MDEYLRVEASYVDAFVAFAEESGVDQLEVRSVDDGVGLEEGDVLTVADAASVVRLMLREEVVCKLEAPRNEFAVHVGFDLYMYVGSRKDCPRAVGLAGDLGLFVEHDWPSPQLLDDDPLR